MRWSVIAGLLLVITGACSLAGPPDEEGLRAGRYRVQFDIAAGAGVPSTIVGRHDFTFVAIEPTTVKESFSISSATLAGRQFYLNAQFNETVPQESVWAISWKLAADAELRVSVEMKEEAAGQFSLPSGCHVLSDAGADYVGSNCSVVREQ